MNRASPLRVRDYLEHIILAIDNIHEYTSGMDAAAYLSDRKTQDAVVRNLEVIGEACNNVVKQDAAFAVANAAVPWNIAYEMRNALAHGYFKVDHQVVWQTLKADLPDFRVKVQVLLDGS